MVAGAMTVGDLVLVNAYLLQLSAPLFLLGMMYREVKQALTNMERLFGLLDERLDVQDRPDASHLVTQRPRVCFEEVRFGYDPRRQILRGIDFGIPPGGTVAVVGHSGSGKFILGLPDGYETQIGERGLKLSGGEKQRVAIARAVLKNPAILIFDEATSALDSKSERAIQAELDRIQVGRTTLVIAHRLSTVMNADQILIMEAGRIVERGDHRQLLASGGLYTQMWRLQQREAAEAAVSSGPPPIDGMATVTP